MLKVKRDEYWIGRGNNQEIARDLSVLVCGIREKLRNDDRIPGDTADKMIRGAVEIGIEASKRQERDEKRRAEP